MSTWVIPPDAQNLDEAQDGDLLVRVDGDELHVARVVEDAVEWLGGAPIETIELPDVDRPTLLNDDQAEQVEAFAEALAARGG